jgi:hypothetical protein
MLKKDQVSHFTKTIPFFLFLLPVFFVLHGFIEYYPSVPVIDALLLTLIYVACELLIAGIGWFIYRNVLKACLLALSLLVWHCFFGSMQDFLKNSFPQSFISQYRFTLPAAFFAFLTLFIWLKKKKKPLFALTRYLNLALMVIILIDMPRLLMKMNQSEKDLSPELIIKNIVPCDTCQKPDIYLILLDQYAGSTALKEVFHFDNSAFEQELNRRNFHIVPESRSNYNLTPFSMASSLNMDYLPAEMGVKHHLNVGYSYRMIRSSKVVKFLTTNGYQFYNYSVFDFPKQPAHEYGAFLSYGIGLITWQTFISRITADIRLDILSGKLGFSSIQKKIAYEHLHFNDNIFELTRNIAAQRPAKPKFVYAHFILPHYPYYFDSKGQSLPMEKLSGFRRTDSNDYIEYLQYGNQKILKLVDDILASSATPPVIMLLSDHGFRHPDRKALRKYDFMNLNAVYLPGKDHRYFNDSLTNVNQFRALFNTYFGQQFHFLKDSTVDLWD